MEQVVIVGAGPCGLSAAIELKKKGFDPLVIEKGSIVHSIYNYPTYMIFHSTPELLEIGGMPFVTPNEKPTRLEALTYYRTVASRYQLRIRCYEKVTRVEPAGGAFRLTAENRFGERIAYDASRVVIATGYFDTPNRLGVPGENLPKVFSYYKEAHPYAGMKVAIVGGNNSAVDAALDLQRAGAEVTVIYRRAELSSRVKAWTRPLFESMVNKGRIRMMYRSHVKEIREHDIAVENSEGQRLTLPNDFVFALIGYRPDRTLLESLGVGFDAESGVPTYDAATMETNVPGVYLAGVIAAGNDANSIFIETGRFHGERIAADIAAKCGEGNRPANRTAGAPVGEGPRT